MKKIKSYTGIWNVEKVLYAINDFNLPFPVTFTQITWFVITEFLIILFGDMPPLSMIEGAFLKYFGIPVALWYYVKKKYKLKVNFSYNIPFFHPASLSILSNSCLYTFSYSFGDRYPQ